MKISELFDKKVQKYKVNRANRGYKKLKCPNRFCSESYEVKFGVAVRSCAVCGYGMPTDFRRGMLNRAKRRAKHSLKV